MQLSRWIRRSLSLAAVTLVGAASQVFAQGQELFEWYGRVDREVQIVMRGNDLWTRQIGATESGRARSRTFRAIPRRDGQVVVEVEDGRGQVDVIQQPHSRNGYTTIVRIVDPRSGSDTYRLAAYWRTYSNGEYIGKDRGRGRARGQDRDDDRGSIYRDRDNDDYDGRNGRDGNRTMLHWSGNVDDELEIRIQNNRIDYRTLRGAEPTSIRADRANVSMPRSSANVVVAQNQGRGAVTVTQQPAAWNGYTTVLRVRDPQGGYGFYDFELLWQ